MILKADFEADFENTLVYSFTNETVFLYIAKIFFCLVMSLNKCTHSHLGMHYSHDPQIFKLKGVRGKKSEESKTNKHLLIFQINTTFFITVSCNIAAMVVG